jgi:polygalacturonase
MTTHLSVRDHGAVGDGTAVDTEAINRAIDACAASGGGVVQFEPGTYMTATVRLGSNVTLLLEAGATLKGVDDPEAYHGFEPDGKASRWHRAMILADQADDAAIVGPGTIDGSKVFDPRGEESMRGPHTVMPACCRGFRMRDVTIVNSANYAIFPILADDIDIHNVTVYGGWDGFHIRGTEDRSCRCVRVTDCRFFTGDDAIAGTWADDVVIRGCLLNSSCNGIRWIGPAERMVIDDCLVNGPGLHPHITQSRHNTLVGMVLQPSAWSNMPGTLDDVQISNVTIHKAKCPFMFAVKPDSRIGRIQASRITATDIYGTAASIESWAEHAIDEVILHDIDIRYALPGDVAVDDADVSEPHVGSRELPAWGLYTRRVRRLELAGIRLRCTPEQSRPATRFDQVDALEVDDLRLPAWAQADDSV